MEPIARTVAATADTTAAAASVHISQEQFVSWRRQKVAADAVICAPLTSPHQPPSPQSVRK